MNIMAQVCGIVIILIVLIFYRRQRKIQLKTGKIFLSMCALCLYSLTLDILSLVCIAYRGFLPELLVDIVCKAYICSLVWLALSAIFYICTDIFGVGNLYRYIIILCCVTSLIGSALIFATPIYIMQEENSFTAYTYGPSTLITYSFTAIALLAMCWLLYKYGKLMNPKRREAVKIWLAVWTSAAIIQFIFSELLLVSFASSISILIIFIKLENPETNIDRRTGMFNESAFLLYTKQCLERKKNFYLLSLSYSQENLDNVPAEIDMEIKRDLLSSILREQDTLLFRGSDHYIVFLCNKEEKITQLIDDLKNRFAKPIKNMSLTPKFIVLSDITLAREENDLRPLLQYAYQHEYEYGNNGVITITQQIANAMYEERETEKLIIDAMEQGRVEVFYQPIYSTEEHSFSSAEALVRIRREDGSLVPPGLFIGVAEKRGLIIHLGKIVFEQVCLFIKENDLEKLGLHCIEVNLSVVQCGHVNLAKDFITIMEKHKVSPEMINLEITESASLQKKNILLENMEKLRQYGIGFSLDDFGTGQSNLNYIVDMPVDIVKFDRGMTQSYFENEKAKYILDATMLMIQGLDLKIVSEGIETKEQYEIMENLGIHYIQGFYFSKPLPKDEFIQFLERVLETTK